MAVLHSQVKIKVWLADLQLTHKWTIARGAGSSAHKAVLIELTDKDGLTGLGEAAPSRRYDESIDSAKAFLEHVDPAQLVPGDFAKNKAYLDTIAPGQYSAKGAIDIALLDLDGKRAGKPIFDMLGLGFTEGKHKTSFSIGIDSPDVIRTKVQAAENYPILKLKVGVAGDKENFKALREVAPRKTVRVDANEGWKTKEEALKNIEWLAADGYVEFIEQPMPTETSIADLKWLKERSPLPLMADESYISAKNIDHCAECFHSVNVKLVKAGGITPGYEALKKARAAGLKTMLGCMIETSVLITAAAHLAELCDYLDIDGNLLISNDPFKGASGRNGIISFADAPFRKGLCVEKR